MRILARKTLVEFGQTHPDAKAALDTWWHIVKRANWGSPQDVKNAFPKASIIADNRVVFDIVGSSYRLVVKFNYPYRMGYIRFIGTHADYDATDIKSV